MERRETAASNSTLVQVYEYQLVLVPAGTVGYGRYHDQAMSQDYILVGDLMQCECEVRRCMCFAKSKIFLD